jgi:hypothetical protein
MLNASQVLVFNFSGETEDNKTEGSISNESQALSELNQNSDEIATMIQKEIRKFIPPQISVQTVVNFEAGSIIMTGTVLLFDWIGSIALKAGKEEIENQFGKIVKVGIQRVFSRYLSRFPFLAPMKVNVTPEQTSEEVKPDLTAPDINVQSNFKSISPAISKKIDWHLILIIIVLLIQIILIADRFFVISFKN